MANINYSNDNTYFEVIDGWAPANLFDGGISDVVYPAAEQANGKYTPSGTTTPINPGSICVVNVNTANGRKEAQHPLLDTSVLQDANGHAPSRFWLCVEGNSEYEWSSRLGDTGKVVLAAGDLVIRTRHIDDTGLALGDRVTVEYDSTGTVGATLPHITVGGLPGTNLGRFKKYNAAAAETVLGYVSGQDTVNGVTVWELTLKL